MIIAGIDLETTGLDVTKNGIVEVAVVLWDTEVNTAVDIFSSFVKDNKVEIDWTSEEGRNCLEICGISASAFNYETVPKTQDLIDQIDLCLAYADYIVACNGDQFDKPMLENFYSRHEMKLPKKTWIDMLYDVEYPESCRAKNLLYLAAFHGFINPFPHRALFDVMTMLKVLSCYDITEVIKSADSPFVNVIANVSYDDRQLAKDVMFRWKGGYQFPFRVEMEDTK